MTNYPDEGPPSGEQPSDAVAGTEPTQPVAYWERQAAERAEEQGEAQVGRPDPTTPYPQDPGPQGGQTPYGQQNLYPPPPGQPGHQPYPPAPGGFPGQPPYNAWAHPLPDHPQSTLALVLGLVGLVGVFVLCGLTLVVSPFAWAVGRSASREIEASQGRLGGAGNAKAGMIMGIIGTVLLILAILAGIALVALLVAAESTTTGSPV